MIVIDGARFASLPQERVAELGLRDGLEVGEATMDRMRIIADQEGAYRRAMRLLAARPRATHELLRRLKLAGHNPSAAAHAVGRLEGQGLLDDAEFARHFARTRAPRGHAPGRLLRDLLARGVERRTAELAIAETQEAEGTDPSAQAEALARRRAAQLTKLDDDAKLRRIVGYLGRRGFVGGDVVAMVRKIVRGA
ncbi:MAG: regulatory protein RecX [Gemmatimonadales bacterium]